MKGKRGDMLSKRQHQVVTYLMQQSSPVTIEHLSRAHFCSYKTMSNELKNIESIASSLQLKILKKPSQGVSLLNKENPKWQVLVKEVNYIDPDFRQVSILLHLLSEKTVKPKDLVEKLSVSRQTITRDLMTINKNYCDKTLQQSTRGATLTLEESVLRERLKNQWITKQFLLVFQEWIKKDHQHLVEESNTFLEDLQQKQNAEFEISSLTYLQTLISLLLIRSKLNPFNEENLSHQESAYFNESNIALDTNAKKLIAQAISGARINKGTLIANHSNQGLANELLNKLCNALNLDRLAHQITINGLLLHLQATLSRVKSNQAIENPLLEDVRVSLGLLYDVVYEVMSSFEKEHNLSFSEHEISYVVMHVAVLMQSEGHMQAPTKIAIVCQFGMATSKLLLSKIEAILPNHSISGPYSVSEFNKLTNTNAFDYIITTTPLGISNELVVSPLLTNKDITLIETTIWNTTYWKQCDLLINNYRVHKVDTLMIQDMIKAKHIVLSDQSLSYRQAISKAAQGLLDDGIIEQSYIEKMIWAVETLGPYMVILPQVAFVHAAYDDGVNKNGISLLRLSQSTVFGERNPVQVKAIFVIASKIKEDMGLLKLVKILE